MLPEIRSSSEVYGPRSASSQPARARSPIAGILGDQQAATFGQAAFATGRAKNTYGTGNFLIVGTGDQDRALQERAGRRPSPTSWATHNPHYALEGSIAVTGSLVQWLRDNLGLSTQLPRSRPCSRTRVADNGGAYFVPAFSGLFAPHWLSPMPACALRRSHPLREQGPHRPRRARGDRLPDPRGHRRGSQRSILACAADRAQGRRRRRPRTPRCCSSRPTS